MEQLIARLDGFAAAIAGFMERLGIESKKRRLERLEAQAGEPEFWSNPESAQKVMQEISKLRAEVERWGSLHARILDALELAGMGDSSLLEELTQETDMLAGEVERMSLQAMLAGPYDNENAILAIHAGAGGTEAQDWAQMLERMYLRFAERNGYKVEYIHRMEGEEAGIKSMSISIKGDMAYGYLQSETGVHRLVRISPFDASARRHTSFAKVELWPDIQGEIEIDVPEKDVKVETYRSSGAGGQNVQKNETAVRLTHLPTGIVVTCQNERSLTQNRERAMQILKSRLLEMERLRREKELALLKGENVDAGWGNQIRSYVLHPYQMVKDHRTGYEVGNPNAVLDGDLNGFMEAYLRYKISGRTLSADPEPDILGETEPEPQG
ncbi:MAG: peptide chain release factor 2 [Anaerolineae bacterium]|nr:peptide chain release factor 2 [Anaerolineae bacterium]NUQ03849.1 peptide chain release factor 2 [Anaerolineae bacterium]